MSENLLDIKDLNVRFATPDGEVAAVSDMNFHLKRGECLGVVGESGSGKSQVFMTVMGLLAKNGSVTGSIKYNNNELVGLSAKQMNQYRGSKISMIFQDPMTSLNPFLKVSRQMTEVLVKHKKLSMKEAKAESIRLLDLVGIPEATKRFNLYPHEFSGGMRQRVMIAMALLCEPEMLIADEPTTALDVTIQAQILELIASLKDELNMAVILITHDMGVVAGLCDRVMVMYGGRIVESSDVEQVFSDAKHPYTQGLLHSMPKIDSEQDCELIAIDGQPPNLQNLPKGCAFHERCPHAFEPCFQHVPLLNSITKTHQCACHLESAS